MTTANASTISSKEPPGPALPVATEDPLQFLLDLVRDYGDVVRYPSPYGPVYFFNHPDHVQAIMANTNIVRTLLLTATLGNGLLTSEGEFWRTQRRLMQPLFHEHCLKAFATAVTDSTLAMLDRWDAEFEEGEAFDFAFEMRRLTLEVIVKALFSIELGSEALEWTDIVTTLVNDLGAIAITQFNMPMQFTPARNAGFQEAVRRLTSKADRMIADRRALKERPRDLLTLLVEAVDEKTGKPLEERQIRDEIVTMLIAGHETTAITLAWTWHLLLENPGIAGRMTAEVEEALQGRAPVAGDMQRLCYTGMVLEEAMRLYPPVSFTARQTAGEVEVAGFRIPPRTLVLLSAYTTHRHPDFWEEPERFDPERFAPEKSAGIHRCAWFPFFGGRHQCIGQSFAMLEGVFITAMLLQRRTIRRAPGHPVEARPEITLRLRHGLMVTAEKRGASERK